MFISDHLSSKQMKEYIDLFADINELFIRLITLFIRLITLGEIILKELRNCILRTILVGSLFYSIRVYTSLFSIYSFGKLVFLSFCAFCVYCQF